MKRLAAGILLIAWALWLGGAVATMLFVQRLFHNDRALAVLAAPQLFLFFEKYQIVLAASSIIGLVISRRRPSVTLASLILTAAVAAGISAFIITPGIEHLRLTGQQATAAFRRLHGISMLVYLLEVAVLLATGFVFGK